MDNILQHLSEHHGQAKARTPHEQAELMDVWFVLGAVVAVGVVGFCCCCLATLATHFCVAWLLLLLLFCHPGYTFLCSLVATSTAAAAVLPLWLHIFV